MHRYISLVGALLFTVTACSDLPTIHSRMVAETDSRVVVSVDKGKYGAEDIVQAVIFNRGKRTLEMGVCPVILERLNSETGEWADAWPEPEVCILPLWTAPAGEHLKFPIRLRNDAAGIYRLRLPSMWFSGNGNNSDDHIYPVYTPQFEIVDKL